VHYQTVDTCHTLGLVAPPGWQVVATGDHHPYWLYLGGVTGFPPGQVQGGFEMTLSRPACCFDTTFPDFAGISTVAETWVCFDCANGATPTRTNSWGTLKVLYR
jgi:hypothetical protein